MGGDVRRRDGWITYGRRVPCRKGASRWRAPVLRTPLPHVPRRPSPVGDQDGEEGRGAWCMDQVRGRTNPAGIWDQATRT